MCAVLHAPRGATKSSGLQSPSVRADIRGGPAAKGRADGDRMDELTAVVERRRNLALRSAFDEAFPRIKALLDTSNTWGGRELTMLAYRAVRESHPQLPPSDVQILVDAACRVHRSQRTASTRASADSLSAPAV